MPLSARRRGGEGSERRQGAELADDGGARLAAAWAAEAPAELHWRRMPTQPAEGEQCAQCGGPLVWHSARTALYCPGCNTSDVSPGVADRAEAHRAALVRRRQGAELADPDAERRARAARVLIRQQRETLTRYARHALGVCDPEAHDRAQHKRLAFELGSRIRAYFPEIDAAADTAALLEIGRELAEIRDGSEWRELADGAEQTAAWRDAAAAADADADSEGEYPDAEQDRAELAEGRRQLPAAELATPASIAEQQHRAQLPAASGYATTAALLYNFGAQIGARREARARAIETNGQCGWCSKPTPATRVYGAGYRSGWGGGAVTLAQDRPAARACARHYTAAAAWIEQECGGTPTYFWEISA